MNGLGFVRQVCYYQNLPATLSKAARVTQRSPGVRSECAADRIELSSSSHTSGNKAPESRAAFDMGDRLPRRPGPDGTRRYCA